MGNAEKHLSQDSKLTSGGTTTETGGVTVPDAERVTLEIRKLHEELAKISLEKRDLAVKPWVALATVVAITVTAVASIAGISYQWITTPTDYKLFEKWRQLSASVITLGVEEADWKNKVSKASGDLTTVQEGRKAAQAEKDKLEALSQRLQSDIENNRRELEAKKSEVLKLQDVLESKDLDGARKTIGRLHRDIDTLKDALSDATAKNLRNEIRIKDLQEAIDQARIQGERDRSELSDLRAFAIPAGVKLSRIDPTEESVNRQGAFFESIGYSLKSAKDIFKPSQEDIRRQSVGDSSSSESDSRIQGRRPGGIPSIGSADNAPPLDYQAEVNGSTIKEGDSVKIKFLGRDYEIKVKSISSTEVHLTIDGRAFVVPSSRDSSKLKEAGADTGQ